MTLLSCVIFKLIHWLQDQCHEFLAIWFKIVLFNYPFGVFICGPASLEGRKRQPAEFVVPARYNRLGALPWQQTRRGYIGLAQPLNTHVINAGISSVSLHAWV